MAEKRAQMFDMLRQIIDKYDETDAFTFTTGADDADAALARTKHQAVRPVFNNIRASDQPLDTETSALWFESDAFFL